MPHRQATRPMQFWLRLFRCASRGWVSDETDYSLTITAPAKQLAGAVFVSKRGCVNKGSIYLVKAAFLIASITFRA